MSQADHPAANPDTIAPPIRLHPAGSAPSPVDAPSRWSAFKCWLGLHRMSRWGLPESSGTMLGIFPLPAHQKRRCLRCLVEERQEP